MRASLARRAAFTAMLGLLIVFFGASAASAHSDTFSSIPAAGSTSANVTQIQFTFAEPVQKSMGPEMVLQSGEHITIPTGAPTFDVTGATMTVPITAGALPNGNYTATYRVVSIDGHVASGVLSFTVAGSSTAAMARDASAAPVTTAVPNELAASSDGWASAFTPLVVSLVALLPLIVGLAILIATIRRRERRKERR